MKWAIGLLCLCVAGCYPYTPPVAAGLKVNAQKGVFGGGMSLETGSDAAVKIENVKWHRDENIVEVGLAEAGLDTTTPLAKQMELAPALFAATAALDAQRADNIALVINALGDQPAKAIGVLQALYGGRSRLAFAGQGMRDPNEPEPGTVTSDEKLDRIIELLEQQLSKKPAPPVIEPPVEPAPVPPADDGFNTAPPAPASTGNGNG